MICQVMLQGCTYIVVDDGNNTTLDSVLISSVHLCTNSNTILYLVYTCLQTINLHSMSQTQFLTKQNSEYLASYYLSAVSSQGMHKAQYDPSSDH